jgi:glycosyltransferase involved in cell wall biosynthesis
VRISIVTISFNQRRFLEEAILSVLNQEYSKTEYIVVDAGSTDGSRELIEKYRTRIDKIVFESDRGPADGLNKGFAQATGEICGYINADDYFEVGAFRHVVKYFQKHPIVDVMAGAIRIVDEHGRARIRKRMSDSWDLKKITAGTCTVYQQATFFRRKAFERTKGFNINNHSCWDLELLVDMSIAGCEFATVQKILGNFRIHERSLTGSRRLFQDYLREIVRLEGKIEMAGVARYSSLGIAIEKLRHKLNVARHLRSLMLR